MAKWLSYIGGHSLIGFHDNSFEVKDSARLKKLHAIEADAQGRQNALTEIAAMEQEQRERLAAARVESDKQGRHGLKAAAIAKGWKVSSRD